MSDTLVFLMPEISTMMELFNVEKYKSLGKAPELMAYGISIDDEGFDEFASDVFTNGISEVKFKLDIKSGIISTDGGALAPVVKVINTNSNRVAFLYEGGYIAYQNSLLKFDAFNVGGAV